MTYICDWWASLAINISMAIQSMFCKGLPSVPSLHLPSIYNNTLSTISNVKRIFYAKSFTFIWYYFTYNTFAGFIIRLHDLGICDAELFCQNDDNIAQAETLHTIHKVSFLVLENRFRLDWAVTFPSTVEGKGSDTDFFNIYGFFDATQGQSRCSSYTS